jgi:hypothetical protein
MAKKPSDSQEQQPQGESPFPPEPGTGGWQTPRSDRPQITFSLPPLGPIVAVVGIVVLTVVAVLVVQKLTEEAPPATPDPTLVALQSQATQLAIVEQTQTAAALVSTPTVTAQVMVVTATPAPQVVTATPVPQVLVVTNPPPPAPQVIVVTATSERMPPTSAPESRSFTRGQVDAVIGAGNWRCFPDRLDGIAVQIVNAGFVVRHPLSAMDKDGTRYVQGQSVPGTGGATGWLAGTLASRDECPSEESLPTCLKLSDLAKLGTIIQELESPPGVLAGAQIAFTKDWTAPVGWVIHRYGETVQSVQAGDTASVWSAETCRPLAR